MSTNEQQEKRIKRLVESNKILSSLNDVFEINSKMYTERDGSSEKPYMRQVGMKVCSGYARDNRGQYFIEKDARYSRLHLTDTANRASIKLHGYSVDLDPCGYHWNNESFVVTSHNIEVLNRYTLILDNFFNTTVVKHLIYDNDVCNIDIDIYADEFYEDDGDIFSQGVTMYETYRTCSVKVTISRKRERTCIFNLYLAKLTDDSLKIIYTDIFREVGLLNELRMSLIGHTCTPLCESTSTRMYNNELNALFAEAAKPRTRQEKNWFDKDAKPERIRSSRLFF